LHWDWTKWTSRPSNGFVKNGVPSLTAMDLQPSKEEEAEDLQFQIKFQDSNSICANFLRQWDNHLFI